MGFLSKLWKGVKKTVKKIFKPIKSVFKKVGKFMNKIGIVGQLAMSFILPGIGNALMAGFGTATAALAGGALGSIGKAAGWVLGKAGTFAKTLATGFKTVTGAVTDFIGTTAKYVGGKLGIGTLPNQTLGQAFGSEGFGGRLTDSFTKLGDQASNFWNSTTADFADRGLMTVAEKTAADLAAFGGTKAAEGIAVQSTAPVTDPLTGEVKSGFMEQAQTGLDSKQFNKLPGELSQNVLSTEVAASKQGLLSKGFEKITGEKTVGDFISTAPGKAKDYAVDSLLAVPGSIVKSTFKEGLSKAVGLGPEEYEQGPSWRANNPHAYQSGYAQSQQESAAPMSFESFAQQNMAVYNTDPRGAYGGSENYGAYMQRFGTGG
jgi:hypothetical protein